MEKEIRRKKGEKCEDKKERGISAGAGARRESEGPEGRETREGEEEKRAREQLAAAERQSCAHFFS